MSPCNNAIPVDVPAAAEATRMGIIDDLAPAFARPITESTRHQRLAAGGALDDAALWEMDWHLAGVSR